MNKIQLRCEFRTDGPGRSIIGKIPYNSIADLGDFRETLKSGCFSESLASGRKVVALLGHDQNKPLGNSRAGTLVLDDQADGLGVTIIPDQGVSWGKDALLAAGRGDFGGLSFGFYVPKGGEVRKGNLREIWRAELLEISPCTWPAYEESTISTRNQQSMETEMNNQTTIHPRQNREYITESGEKLFTREDLRRMDEEYEARGGRVEPPNLSFGFGGQAYVQDQPIYRGPTALGQQMVDIIHLSRSGAVAPEARDRHDQMVKRERALAEKRAAGTGGMVEAVGQDGGLLLQGETSMEMLTSGFNNSAVLSRAARRDIGVNQFADLVGVDETSRADGSRGGGVRVYTDKELEQILQSKPKLAKIRLEPKRLTGMYFASNEILQNAPLLQQEMADLFNEEFSFKGQDLAVNGSGAGEALGVLKAPCLVTVAKEATQVANTIVFQNLVNMKARIRVRNRNSLLWIANQDVEAQLYTLSLPVGTGGSVMPAYVPSANQADGVAGTLLGTPICFVEQCATLGTVGDIVLGDWSSYWAANKGGVEYASSIHLKFDYNQTAFRFVTYFDGQPKLKSAITPYKGSNTVSPFVALATRS